MWFGADGVISDSVFSDSSAFYQGGAISLMALNGAINGCTFTHNTAGTYGGAISWMDGSNGDIIGCTFTNNTAKYGGAVRWVSFNGTVTNSIFNNNTATIHGGGIHWEGANGTITNSIFNGNRADNQGGAIRFNAANCILTNSYFTNNNAPRGGAIFWNTAGLMNNCSFINSKSQASNGINAENNLNINGGNGIVYINIQGNLSGINIIALNNETYYHPPNTNINLPNKIMLKIRQNWLKKSF